MVSRTPWSIDIYGRLDKIETDFTEFRSELKVLGDKTDALVKKTDALGLKTDALGDKSEKSMLMMNIMFSITTIISLYAAVKPLG